MTSAGLARVLVTMKALALALLCVLILGCSSSGGAASSASSSATSSLATSPSSAPTAAAVTTTATAKGPPLSGDEIAKSLKASLLGAADVVVHTDESDPNKLLGRPGQYVSKVNWKKGGAECSIEVFPDLEGAQKRVKYIDGIGKGASMLLQYTALHEAKNAMIHCDHALTPKDFDAAKAWMMTL